MLTIIIGFCLLFTSSSYAMLNLELTRGVSGAIPIAIVPFAIQGSEPSEDVSGIINHDLKNSGRFKVVSLTQLNPLPTDVSQVTAKDFKKLGVDSLVVGNITALGGNRYQVNFQLIDSFTDKTTDPKQSITLSRQFVVGENELRPLAHHISDMIYQQMTGIRGIFSTRLAYIVVQRNGRLLRYTLEVADQDGYNPRSLLVSKDPIMSPAWSPDGKKIAYVSFENRHAAIYVQNVATGARQLISEFPGINGAPAWSPDGNKLALVLSKSGAPNIYMMEIGSHQLTQLTHDFYINTEPAFSPDGRKIIFTSNRSGTPQIYQMEVATRTVSRVTYDGKYNARASYTRDGNHIVVLNQESGLFNIGILDLDTGVFRVLTNSSDHESPSIAPNGTMVLFGNFYRGQNILGMVATDGSVMLRLPAREGDVQDPAWSPFLS
jgi:TolB protein